MVSGLVRGGAGDSGWTPKFPPACPSHATTYGPARRHALHCYGFSIGVDDGWLTLGNILALQGKYRARNEQLLTTVDYRQEKEFNDKSIMTTTITSATVK